MIGNRFFRDIGLHASLLATVLLVFLPLPRAALAQGSVSDPKPLPWARMAPAALRATANPQQWDLIAGEGRVTGAWLEVIEEEPVMLDTIKHAAETASERYLSLSASLATAIVHQDGFDHTVWGLIIESVELGGGLSRTFAEVLPVANVAAARQRTEATLKAVKGASLGGSTPALPPSKLHDFPSICDRDCRGDWIRDSNLCDLQAVACFVGVTAFAELCVFACPATGPLTLACLAACLVAEVAGLLTCDIVAQQCLISAERDYEACFTLQELDCREDPAPPVNPL